MSKEQDPQNWLQPNWHSDYGDAKTEFEHLQRLAAAILSSIPETDVDLLAPEPGLLFLSIDGPYGLRAEAYSVCGEGEMKRRKYALFLTPGTPLEHEVYTENLGEAIAILQGETKLA